MNRKELVGSGSKIVRLTMPFLLMGLAMNFIWPNLFSVGGPPMWLMILSIAMFTAGIIVWAWSAALILTKVPRKQLITTGPFHVVKHPLYTSVALLVLPWMGFLLDTWLGVVLGIVMYLGSRIYSPEEERQLSETFGFEWDKYSAGVQIPWL